VGKKITFTFKVTNAGPLNATGVALTDLLPKGVKVVSATGGVKPINKVLTFHVGTMPRGTSETLNLVLKRTKPGKLKDVATVSGDQLDPTPADNTFTYTTPGKHK
jgi:uncharacterized repeat protein (TIGR01451 family)